MQSPPLTRSKDGCQDCGGHGRAPFFAWPGWPFLRFAWLWSLAASFWFMLIYGGCDWVTRCRSLRVPLHLEFELSIPFVPAMCLAYMSIYLLFLGGPFVIRERREFLALIQGLALTTLAGGVGFILLPAETAYGPPGDLGIWRGLYQVADCMNLTYNLAPSLHVALTVCCLAAFARHASPVGALLLWAWGGVIALSTILTHQHHLVDAATGWILGLAAFSITVGRLDPLQPVQQQEPAAGARPA